MIEINLLPWRAAAPSSFAKQWLILLVALFLGISLFYMKYSKASELPAPAPPKEKSIPVVSPPDNFTWQKIRFAGYLRQGNVMWGLMQLPNGSVQEVKVGDAVGLHGAHVKSIATDHLVIVLKNQHERILRGY